MRVFGSEMLCRNVVVGVFLFGACSSTTSNPGGSSTPVEEAQMDKPAPGAVAQGSDDPGAINRSVLEAAVATQDPGRASLRVEADGSIQKVSLYSTDFYGLPEAIRARLEGDLKDAGYDHFELEHYAGIGRIYELTKKREEGAKEGEEKVCELALREDGKEAYKECAIALSEAPKAVQAKIEERAPGAKVLEIEQWMSEETALKLFEVELEKDKKKHYLRIKPDGTLLGHYVQVPARISLAVP